MGREVAEAFKYVSWLRHTTIECKSCGDSKIFRGTGEFWDMVEWARIHHYEKCKGVKSGGNVDIGNGDSEHGISGSDSASGRLGWNSGTEDDGGFLGPLQVGE